MAEITYFTEEGIKKLRDELAQLKGEGRASIAKQIAEARDKGDLSENAEYDAAKDAQGRSEEHTSELQSLMRISYAVFCLKKKRTKRYNNRHYQCNTSVATDSHLYPKPCDKQQRLRK